MWQGKNGSDGMDMAVRARSAGRLVAEGPATLKSQIIASIAQKHRLLQSDDARVALEALLEAMGQALAGGRRIEIRGFGTFHVTIMRARSGRNPKTGKLVEVPAKRVVRFKASSSLVREIDGF
jgi:integration host factor subunit beta